MYKNIDLDDPHIQQALRQTTVSLASIAQVRQLGHSAYERAAKIDAPTLLIQGSRDKVVRSPCTARLLKRFQNGAVQFEELDVGHDLVDPESRVWAQIKDCLLVFAETIREHARTQSGLPGFDSWNQWEKLLDIRMIASQEKAFHRRYAPAQSSQPLRSVLVKSNAKT